MLINSQGMNIVNKTKSLFRWFAISTVLLSMYVLMSCAANDEPELTGTQQIHAEVCIEGSGRDAVLYVRNLNEFSYFF